MGAWIETFKEREEAAAKASHLSWVRGLKPEYLNTLPTAANVAPFVGAWIETFFNHSLYVK